MVVKIGTHPKRFHPEGNVIYLGVGNAVPGVPSGAMRKHRARKEYCIAAFGGRNAEDGVPYGCLGDFQLRQIFLRKMGGVGAVGGGGDDLAEGLGADIAHGVDTGEIGFRGLVGDDVAAL